MGLKLLTLALCSVTGKKVKIHSTGKEAKVLTEDKNGKTSYSLLFDDGSIKPVSWSEDNQGYIPLGDELDEIEEITIV